MYITDSQDAMFAADNKFGPEVYEVAFGDRVVNVQDPSTIPEFEHNMVISFATEKVSKIEDGLLEDHYVGIVDVWKKLRHHKFYNDTGFLGVSPRRIVVCADFGTFQRVETDKGFIHALVSDICKEDKKYEGVIDKYLRDFPQDEMSADILAKVPAAVKEMRENPSDY